MTYDFTAASEFFDTLGASPQEVKDEIDRIMNEMGLGRRFLTIQQTRTLGLLSVFADFIERITPKEEVPCATP